MPEMIASAGAAIAVGGLLLLIEYRTKWFARHQNTLSVDGPARRELEIQAFVDELILTRRDPRVSTENVERVRRELRHDIERAVNLHLVGLLSESDQYLLERLLDKNAPTGVMKEFFGDKIENIDAETLKALMAYRVAYLVDTGGQGDGSTKKT